MANGEQDDKHFDSAGWTSVPALAGGDGSADVLPRDNEDMSDFLTRAGFDLDDGPAAGGGDFELQLPLDTDLSASDAPVDVVGSGGSGVGEPRRGSTVVAHTVADSESRPASDFQRTLESSDPGLISRLTGEYAAVGSPALGDNLPAPPSLDPNEATVAGFAIYRRPTTASNAVVPADSEPPSTDDDLAAVLAAADISASHTAAESHVPFGAWEERMAPVDAEGAELGLASADWRADDVAAAAAHEVRASRSRSASGPQLAAEWAESGLGVHGTAVGQPVIARSADTGGLDAAVEDSAAGAPESVEVGAAGAAEIPSGSATFPGPLDAESLWHADDEQATSDPEPVPLATDGWTGAPSVVRPVPVDVIALNDADAAKRVTPDAPELAVAATTDEGSPGDGRVIDAVAGSRSLSSGPGAFDGDDDGDDADDAAETRAAAVSSQSLRSVRVGSGSGSGDHAAYFSGDYAAAPGGVERSPSLTPFALDAAAPVLTVPELEGGLPSGSSTWATDFALFREEAQRLARAKRWRRLAAMTAWAIQNAPYSVGGTRTGLLLDLARVYRDRLADSALALEAFEAVSARAPDEAEALGYLVDGASERGDFRRVFELYHSAVASTWDPDLRMTWTLAAAEVARERLRDPDLVVRAWELVAAAGEPEPDAQRALVAAYRAAGRWGDLAAYVGRLLDKQDAVPSLLLRELAEIELAGNQRPEAAAAILERLASERRDDPIVTQQLARIYAETGDWDRLERLATDGVAALGVAEARARRMQVADALWEAGRLAQAAQLYTDVLRVDPGDSLARSRYHSYLRTSGQFDTLMDALLTRADATESDAERADLLATAAEVARDSLGDLGRAIELRERHLGVSPDDFAAWQALAELYSQTGDANGLARALEKVVTPGNLDAPARLDALRRLAATYADGLEDSERAEAAWREILRLDPTDLDSRERLMELHRARGDFEALNLALLRQISLTKGGERALRLSRMAAENLDANADAPDRSVAAWLRVLDYAPWDQAALASLARHYGAAAEVEQQIGAIEQELLAETDRDARVALALRVADLWETAAQPRAAAAAYERVLHWDRRNAHALDALVALYSAAGRTDLALGAVDQAVGGFEDPAEVAAHLRRSVELLSADDARGRFERLRRVHLLIPDDADVLESVLTAGTEAEAHEEVVALLTSRIAALDGAVREALQARRVALLAGPLERPDRAYVARQSSLLAGDATAEVIESLRALAAATGRHEDLLALLERRAAETTDAAERRALIRERARVLEEEIADPRRAFLELRRLIELDPQTWEPINELGRLAHEHGLWGDLVNVLVEVGDACRDDEERRQIAARLEAVGRGPLADAALAFHQTLRQFRLDRSEPDVRAQMLADAAALEEWDWVLPVVEAAELADVSRGRGTDGIVALAELYARETSEPARAFGLVALALAVEPDSSEIAARLGELAESTGAHVALATSLRRAAALADDAHTSVGLLRRAAEILEGPAGAPASAVELHRRLLELRDDERRSLEVMIAAHEDARQWHDLQDRLLRAIEIAADDEDPTERLLRVGTIAEEHLDDPQQALVAYGRVLARDPDNAAALERVEAIVGALDDPRLMLEFSMQELSRAPEEQRAAIELRIARLQLERLDDPEGAVETLQGLVAREGVLSEGFEPLVELLESLGRTRERILLFVDRAAALESAAARRETLRVALDESMRCDDLTSAERETVFRALMEVEPDDVVLSRHYAHLLRSQERFADLAALLADTAAKLTDDAERVEVMRERARLLWCNLDDHDGAIGVWRSLVREDAEDEAALLALAMAALERGDHEEYVSRRRAQARLLPPEDASLVLCHLAEVCDEHEDLSARVADFYREARRVHPNCEPAKLALMAIGRRKKELRPEAALLTAPGERELTYPQRAAALVATAAATRAADESLALDLARRATATDPNSVDAWDLVASLARAAGDDGLAHRAAVGALEALRRTSPLRMETFDVEAGRLLAIAESTLALGLGDEHERMIRRVHSIAPAHAATAVAVSRLMTARGELADAFYVLDSLLARHAASIPADLLSDVYFARGAAHAAAGRVDAARDDFRRALRGRPLFPEALQAFADAEAARGNYVSAIEHLIRALVTELDPARRASLLFRVGVLWEDGLGDADEAGGCYELARAEGLESRELLLRIFRHYQRRGELDRGLDVVDTLLESASDDADELASLWLARGEIYAQHDGREAEAIDAFDMALSYDPDLNAARTALAGVLERRQDWDGLLQILEAITESDAGSATERSDAYLRMARIAQGQLDDPGRAEEYLRSSLAAAPSAAAMRELGELVAARAPGSEAHHDLVAQLVAAGPPSYTHLLDFGAAIVDDRPNLAWCVLAPALMIRSADDTIKARLREMRREYERPPILLASRDVIDAEWPTDLAPLRDVVESLDMIGSLGVTDVASASGDTAAVVSVHSNLGRTFGALASQLGVDGASLYRAGELANALEVFAGTDGPVVAVRADVFQQLARAEIGFVLAYGIELCMPGRLALASLDAAERTAFVEGLWAAVGLRDARTEAGGRLAVRIQALASLEQLAIWADALGAFPADLDLHATSARYWEACRSAARHAGLVAGADLLQVVRLLAKVEADLERPSVFDDAAAFDEYTAGAPGLVDLVRYAATPAFASALASATEL